MTDQISDTEDSIGLEVTVCSNGVINVRREQSDRGHSVFVDGHSVVKCSCKGFKFHGHCVHQEAINQRPIVLSSAQALSTPTTLTDGGTLDESAADSSNGVDQFEELAQTTVESTDSGSSDLGDEGSSDRDHCRLCDRELSDSDDGRTAAGELCFLCDARCERNHPWTRSTNVHKDKSESSGIDEL